MAGLFSCASSLNYQIYNVQQKQGSIDQSADTSITLSYNFWGEDGIGKAFFFNNTDSFVRIHLDQCFFVKNGVSYDYYRNSSIANVENSSETTTYRGAISTSISKGEGTIQTTNDRPTLMLPPHAGRTLKTGNISNDYFFHCDLDDREDGSNVSFDENTSPVTFSNVISYSIGNGSIQRISNHFYISRVMNVWESTFAETISSERCPGKKRSPILETPVLYSNRSFYVTYYPSTQW